MKREVTEVLREMQVGETRQFDNARAKFVDVKKFGPDEFRVCGDLPTSYPNTVRLLRSLGIEEV